MNFESWTLSQYQAMFQSKEFPITFPTQLFDVIGINTLIEACVYDRYIYIHMSAFLRVAEPHQTSICLHVAELQLSWANGCECESMPLRRSAAGACGFS